MSAMPVRTVAEEDDVLESVPSLHLLHVIPSLSPSLGGPPEAVRQLALAYPQVGHSVEIVCLDPPDSPWLATTPCPAHGLGPGGPGPIGGAFRMSRWLSAQAARFDGMVMNGIWSLVNHPVRSTSRRTGIPYAVFTHGALDPWFNRQYPLKRLKKQLYWPLQYPVLRDALAVFFTTPLERDLAATSFSPSRWNGVAVPYGISDPGGDPEAQIATFYSKLPVLRGRRYLLYLSRIHEKKGCDLLLHAFSRLAAAHPEVDLVIAGPDQVGLQPKLQRIAVEHRIADRVHWPGMITGDYKWGALRAAEAYVLPSHQENFGISVVESLAAGRPVLITNQVNIWREIQGDGAGLVDDDTLEGIERMLRQWLALKPQEREAFASHARPCFLARYSMKNAAAVIGRTFWEK